MNSCKPRASYQRSLRSLEVKTGSRTIRDSVRLGEILEGPNDRGYTET